MTQWLLEFLCAATGLQVVKPEAATILGSPISGLEVVEGAIESRTKLVELLGDRL